MAQSYDDAIDWAMPLALCGVAGGTAVVGAAHLPGLVGRSTDTITPALLAYPLVVIGVAALVALLQRHRGQASLLGASAATWSFLSAALAAGPDRPAWLMVAFAVGGALAARTGLLRSKCTPAATLVTGTTAAMCMIVAGHDLGVRPAGAVAAGIGFGGAVAALVVAAALLLRAGAGPD